MKLLTQKQIERINSYYTVKVNESIYGNLPTIQLINEATGFDRNIYGVKYLTFGVKGCKAENLNQLIQDEIVMPVSRRNLTLAYTEMTEDEYDTVETKSDKRTRDYFKSEMDKIGYIKVVNGDGTDRKYTRIDVQDRELEVYFLRASEYGILIGNFCPPDDYQEELWIFSKVPSMKDLDTVKLILNAQDRFKHGACSENFHCWECGMETKHWLDVTGDLEEKLDKLSNKYCGC